MLFGFADAGGEGALGEAGVYLLVGLGIVRVKEDGAFGGVDDGVAAVQDGQGGEGLEAGRAPW